MSEEKEELECLDAGSSTPCEGPVEYRVAMSSTGRSFPRCEKHFDIAYRRFEETQRKYGSPIAPKDFDPLYAGEHWDEDY